MTILVTDDFSQVQYRDSMYGGIFLIEDFWIHIACMCCYTHDNSTCLSLPRYDSSFEIHSLTFKYWLTVYLTYNQALQLSTYKNNYKNYRGVKDEEWEKEKKKRVFSYNHNHGTSWYLLLAHILKNYWVWKIFKIWK